MKKISKLFLISFIIISFCFIGCSKQDEEEKQPEPQKTKEEIIIEIIENTIINTLNVQIDKIDKDDIKQTTKDCIKQRSFDAAKELVDKYKPKFSGDELKDDAKQELKKEVKNIVIKEASEELKETLKDKAVEIIDDKFGDFFNKDENQE